jgi:hypothetical protein
MSEPNITMVSAILATTTPSPDGSVYPEEALKSLAAQYPEKLEYRDGVLYSRDPIVDDEHRARWDRTLWYHDVGELARKATRTAFDTDVWPKMMANQVEPTDTGFKLYLIHPQWGGYGVPATVEFDRCSGDLGGGPGCFELACYHDGEFPTTSVEQEYHCCSAEQFILFGLEVLEAQMQHQQDAQGNPVKLERDQLEGFVERIQKLLGP